jgi:hypothetical protein
MAIPRGPPQQFTAGVVRSIRDGRRLNAVAKVQREAVDVEPFRDGVSIPLSHVHRTFIPTAS